MGGGIVGFLTLHDVLYPGTFYVENSLKGVSFFSEKVHPVQFFHSGNAFTVAFFYCRTYLVVLTADSLQCRISKRKYALSLPE